MAELESNTFWVFLENFAIFDGRKLKWMTLQFLQVIDQNALVQGFSRFSDHQYLWNESSNILDFVNRESHQGK